MSAHRPLRTCVGCRAVADQDQLMRWVQDPQDPTRVLPDAARRRSGRGAWMHPNPACAQRAVQRRGFARAFRSGEITHDLDAVLAALRDLPPREGPEMERTGESGSET